MRIIKTRMQYPDYSEPDPIEARPMTARTIAIALVATIAATLLLYVAALGFRVLP